MLTIWRIRTSDFLVSVLQSRSCILPCTPVMSWPLFMICVLSALPLGTHFTRRLGLCNLHFVSVPLRFIFSPPFSCVLCLVRRRLHFALCVSFQQCEVHLSSAQLGLCFGLWSLLFHPHPFSSLHFFNKSKMNIIQNRRPMFSEKSSVHEVKSF